MKYKHFKQALLFKVGSLLNFRKFCPHALNQRSPAEGKGKGQKPVLEPSNTGGCTGKKQGSKLVSEEKEEREKVESEQKTAG